MKDVLLAIGAVMFGLGIALLPFALAAMFLVSDHNANRIGAVEELLIIGGIILAMGAESYD